MSGLPPGRTAVRFEDRASQRGPRQDLARQRASFEGDRAPCGKAGHDPVGGTGHGVVAHHDERDTQQDRPHRAGKPRVAAHRHDDTGTAADKNHEGEQEGDEEAAERSEVLDRDASLDPPSGEQGDLEARLGHETALHASTGADVEGFVHARGRGPRALPRRLGPVGRGRQFLHR